MADNSKLTVTISAVDRTSAAINAVARKLGGIIEPATKATKSLTTMADASAVTDLSKAVLHLGGSAAGAGVRLAEAFAPLAGLTAAAGLGGLAKMTSNWASFSQGLSFDAGRIGAKIGDLQAFQGAARLAGVSGDAMAMGLRNLQDVMSDTARGRNMQALSYFHDLEVAFDDGAGHARQATKVLPALLDGLKRIADPTRRAEVGVALLGAAFENLFPLAERGGDELKANAEAVRQNGVESEESAKKAAAYTRAQAQLSMASETLGHTISEQVSPSLSGLMDKMTRWLDQHKEMTAASITKWGDDYSAVFGAVGKAIDEAVTHSIGWNNALEIGIPLIAARAIPPLARLENWLAKIVAIRIPAWLGGLIGVSGGAVTALGGTLLLGGDTTGGDDGREAASQKGGAEWEAWRKKHPTVFGWVWDKLFGGGDAPAKSEPNPPATAAPSSPNPPAAGPGFFNEGGTLETQTRKGWNKLWGGDGNGKLPNPGPALPADIEAEVRKQARLKGLDEEHMVRLARAEHGGYNTVSPAGAIGPMQLMPPTARDLHVNPFDWHENIEGGMRHYRKLMDRFGDYAVSDAAYNAGQNRKSVQQFAQTGDLSGLPAETQGYVKKINGAPPASLIDTALRARLERSGSDGQTDQAAADRPAGTSRQSANTINVDVHFRGLPAGATAVATSSGAATSSVRVERAMG